MPPTCLYWRHQLRGEEDEAYRYLQMACEERDSFIIWARACPFDIDIIFEGPRFEQLMNDIGLGNSR